MTKEHVRALSAEFNISTEISKETIRAMSAEANETIRAMSAEANETIRAMSAEANLMQNQFILQNSSNHADVTMLATFAKFESWTMAAIGNLSLELQETKNDLAIAKATLASQAVAAASSASTSGQCSGNSSSLASAVFPDCPVGFSPSASSTPTCPGSSNFFPTTFSCESIFIYPVLLRVLYLDFYL